MSADACVAFGLGLALGAAACLSLYLGAAHQRLRARPWPAMPACAVGALLMALALAALLQALRPAAACFVLATWAMLVLAALPGVAALRRGARER